ncbi:MAG: TetR/AcrR family transcriptional regulator [Chloroflexi bacterium]|nr:TetR/AcrR family transcriptional regulator [Chloroflexota bacterium]
MVHTRASSGVRQHQIVDAARKIITQRGAEHLTIQAVAEAIGLSEAAIYRHFPGKREILLLMLRDVEQDLLEAVNAAERGAPSPLNKLRNIMKGHFSHAERRRGFSFLVVEEVLSLGDPDLSQRASEVVDCYLEALNRVLREAQEGGEVRGDLDLDAAAALFFGIVQGTITLWQLGHHRSPVEQQEAALWSLYCDAVGVSTRGSRNGTTVVSEQEKGQR